jgi:integrase
MPLMAKSTRGRSEGVIKNYLQPTFGKLCLRDLTPLRVQQFLSGMAGSKLSTESRDKIRDVLSSVLRSAVKFGFLVTNPVEGLKVPPGKAGRRAKPYITPHDFTRLLELMPEPYATMVFVAIHTGMRVSELAGLRWGKIGKDSITIDERYCRGDWGAPKTEASNATIPVNQPVIDRLQKLKSTTVEFKAGLATRRYPAVKAAAPTDLVFQSVMLGRPMRDNNILLRFIKPAAEKLAIPWLNWRAMRRSHATWLKLAGADVKDAQAQLRHARASTTLDIYQQFVPECQRKAIDRVGHLTDVLVN